MFVHVVETTERRQVEIGDEGVVVARETTPVGDQLPDVVWLNRLNACPVPFGDPLQELRLVPPVVISVFENGELRPRAGAAPRQRELPRQVVKGRAQVVNDVARDESQPDRDTHSWSSEADAYDRLACIRIRLDERSVGIRVDERAGLVSEGLQMLPGAFYLQASAE